ncbi:MAG TPA: hypothetical protein DGR15_00580 [Methylophilus sp.]|nr:hypothetical protein [Methylophilus sp.]
MAKTLSVYSLALLCFCGAASAGGALPKDVTLFVEQREACDHWRGEYGYDEERQADIDHAVCQSCVGTDDRLAKLKRKYRGRKEILNKLDAFEADIEPEDTSKTAAFCQQVSRQHARKH